MSKKAQNITFLHGFNYSFMRDFTILYFRKRSLVYYKSRTDRTHLHHTSTELCHSARFIQ